MLNALKDFAGLVWSMIYCMFKGHDWKQVGQSYDYCERCGELRVHEGD